MTPAYRVLSVPRHLRSLLESGDPRDDLREPGPFGVRRDCDRVRVANEDHLRPADDHQAAAGIVDVDAALYAHAHYRADQRGAGRDARVTWALKLLPPLLVRAFREESGRTLLAIKA
jgi:hypothetical protein